MQSLQIFGISVYLFLTWGLEKPITVLLCTTYFTNTNEQDIQSGSHSFSVVPCTHTQCSRDFLIAVPNF